MSQIHSSRWLRLKSDSFDDDETVTRRGVEFHVFLSPYDLPDAVRGAFDPKLGRFLIEFRYVVEEPTSTIEANKHVTLYVGSKSKRLQRIAVDVDGLKANEVVLRIENAIDALPQVIPTSRLPTANFRVAKSVIHRNQPELLASLR